MFSIFISWAIIYARPTPIISIKKVSIPSPPIYIIPQEPPRNKLTVYELYEQSVNDGPAM